ncbi:MAG: FGGY-family carbohydrate kinase [Eubacteriales bacterium]|nr:FGGY-family carbohydrate kinase [Eubacteriales bacterium]
MDINRIKEDILNAKTAIGIELGSTRIKAVLIDSTKAPVAAGSHEWENRLENGIWTYSLEDVWTGLQDSYKNLAEDVKEKYGLELTKVGSIGISAMMHGYMAFNAAGELMVPFRTWRNTNSAQAAEKLSAEFNYNIPIRWSISHLYQSILNGEEHVKDLTYFTTLAGYVHWMLSGEKVLGVGDASGMFPIDPKTVNYDETMLNRFDEMTAEYGYSWKIRELLPKVLCAGEDAGRLTAEGAKLLDVSGKLEAGILMCPPEGDAGTGMTATNAVAKRTGNVSAGTSIFSMVVLEKELSKPYPELDLVTTPDGALVAMVHCNNCTSDLNAWVNLFREFQETMGMKVDMNELYGTLYRKALEGDKDCGGLMAYNYLSGEPVTGFEEGRPLFMRKPDANFNLANFMRTHLYASVGALKMGNDILTQKEGVVMDHIMGHGGLFKTKGVGQSFMAAALNTPVEVMETAGEGGAWGIALLAAFTAEKEEGETLPAYLDNRVFAGQKGERMDPDPADVAGFNAFIDAYMKGLPAERGAVESF